MVTPPPRSWHPLLERQLRAAGAVPDGVPQALLTAVDAAYREHDAELRMIERALDLSSQELFERNAELRGLVDALPDSLLVIDTQGRVVASKGRPLPPALVPGIDATGVLSEEAWVSGLRGAIRTALTEDRIVTVDVEPPGAGATFEARCAPNGNGSAIAIVQDVSERRVSETLRLGKEAAEAASQAKSAFLAHVTHELRTPLTAIIGYAELVQEEAEEKGLAHDVRDLAHVITSARHLLTLVGEILDLSRIEAGRMVIEREAVDFDRLADELEAAARALVARRSNTLDVDRPSPTGLGRGDATKLKQIALNLLSNATKFTTDGTVRFGWRRERDRERDWLVCEVTDTGNGMPPETVARLFEPFMRLRVTRPDSQEGAGLGLAITRRLAEAMGGTIQVSSTPGVGSSFVCRVPTDIDDVPARSAGTWLAAKAS